MYMYDYAVRNSLRFKANLCYVFSNYNNIIHFYIFAHNSQLHTSVRSFVMLFWQFFSSASWGIDQLIRFWV